MNIEEAQNWLGERGVYKEKKDIEVIGRWALVIWRDYNEVQCYDLDSSNLYAEAWDEMPYEDSPFILNNAKRTINRLEEIDKEYDKYLKEISV